MKRTRLRSGLLTASLLILAALAWLYLAPSNIGGSTGYVITHGNSMEPRFHTGDLALVRPADRYRVGEIVAYRSSLLRVVVLHRIVALDGSRYVFKGDHNKFLDPTHPDGGALIGALWVRVPHGGAVLAWLHTPLIAAALCGGLGVLLLLGAGEKRRRRNRRRNGAIRSSRQGAKPVHTGRPDAIRPSTIRALLIGFAVALVAFAGLGVIALTRPLHRAATVKVPYSQRVRFGYSAVAPAGPVYPDGVVNTGDPIFLRLVDRVNVRVDYRLATDAPHVLAGTQAILLRLSGPNGWSRDMPLAPPRRFIGDHVSKRVTLDMTGLQSLIGRVQALTGIPAGAGYTVAVVPQVHIRGTLAGKPINDNFGPSLSFQLDSLELLPGNGSTTSGGPAATSSPSRIGSVATAGTATNTLSVDGDALAIATIRWVALAGFVVAAVGLLITLLLKRRQPSGPTALVEAQYGRLIVPIAATADDLARPPIDVTNIKALVLLAECSERLILHHHGDSADTYLVEDEGTVYRYRASLNGEHRAPASIAGRELPAPPAELPRPPQPYSPPPPAPDVSPRGRAYAPPIRGAARARVRSALGVLTLALVVRGRRHRSRR